ncbi:ap2 domain transcription factor ap2viii-6 [Cystoisospora suis]|uniref:Ap2 domain transcription factor ap2viii-6 n=1 Tax=Cystoisospora suis TaxID=483139 RepID=A0A2C6KHL0_9APIC|nr:ap2 domain transcription factor ap2viii-6 [Cystoisospora suis]
MAKTKADGLSEQVLSIAVPAPLQPTILRKRPPSLHMDRSWPVEVTIPCNASFPCTPVISPAASLCGSAVSVLSSPVSTVGNTFCGGGPDFRFSSPLSHAAEIESQPEVCAVPANEPLFPATSIFVTARGDSESSAMTLSRSGDVRQAVDCDIPADDTEIFGQQTAALAFEVDGRKGNSEPVAVVRAKDLSKDCEPDEVVSQAENQGAESFLVARRADALPEGCASSRSTTTSEPGADFSGFLWEKHACSVSPSPGVEGRRMDVQIKDSRGDPGTSDSGTGTTCTGGRTADYRGVNSPVSQTTEAVDDIRETFVCIPGLDARPEHLDQSVGAEARKSCSTENTAESTGASAVLETLGPKVRLPVGADLEERLGDQLSFERLESFCDAIASPADTLLCTDCGCSQPRAITRRLHPEVEMSGVAVSELTRDGAPHSVEPKPGALNVVTVSSDSHNECQRGLFEDRNPSRSGQPEHSYIRRSATTGSVLKGERSKKGDLADFVDSSREGDTVGAVTTGCGTTSRCWRIGGGRGQKLFTRSTPSGQTGSFGCACCGGPLLCSRCSTDEGGRAVSAAGFTASRSGRLFSHVPSDEQACQSPAASDDEVWLAEPCRVCAECIYCASCVESMREATAVPGGLTSHRNHAAEEDSNVSGGECNLCGKVTLPGSDVAITNAYVHLGDTSSDSSMMSDLELVEPRLPSFDCEASGAAYQTSVLGFQELNPGLVGYMGPYVGAVRQTPRAEAKLAVVQAEVSQLGGETAVSLPRHGQLKPLQSPLRTVEEGPGAEAPKRSLGSVSSFAPAGQVQPTPESSLTLLEHSPSPRNAPPGIASAGEPRRSFSHYEQLMRSFHSSVESLDSHVERFPSACCDGETCDVRMWKGVKMLYTRSSGLPECALAPHTRTCSLGHSTSYLGQPADRRVAGQGVQVFTGPSSMLLSGTSSSGIGTSKTGRFPEGRDQPLGLTADNGQLGLATTERLFRTSGARLLATTSTVTTVSTTDALSCNSPVRNETSASPCHAMGPGPSAFQRGCLSAIAAAVQQKEADSVATDLPPQPVGESLRSERIVATGSGLRSDDCYCTPFGTTASVSPADEANSIAVYEKQMEDTGSSCSVGLPSGGAIDLVSPFGSTDQREAAKSPCGGAPASARSVAAVPSDTPSQHRCLWERGHAYSAVCRLLDQGRGAEVAHLQRHRVDFPNKPFSATLRQVSFAHPVASSTAQSTVDKGQDPLAANENGHRVSSNLVSGKRYRSHGFSETARSTDKCRSKGVDGTTAGQVVAKESAGSSSSVAASALRSSKLDSPLQVTMAGEHGGVDVGNGTFVATGCERGRVSLTATPRGGGTVRDSADLRHYQQDQVFDCSSKSGEKLVLDSSTSKLSNPPPQNTTGRRSPGSVLNAGELPEMKSEFFASTSGEDNPFSDSSAGTQGEDAGATQMTGVEASLVDVAVPKCRSTKRPRIESSARARLHPSRVSSLCKAPDRDGHMSQQLVGKRLVGDERPSGATDVRSERGSRLEVWDGCQRERESCSITESTTDSAKRARPGSRKTDADPGWVGLHGPEHLSISGLGTRTRRRTERSGRLQSPATSAEHVAGASGDGDMETAQEQSKQLQQSLQPEKGDPGVTGVEGTASPSEFEPSGEVLRGDGCKSRETAGSAQGESSWKTGSDGRVIYDHTGQKISGIWFDTGRRLWRVVFTQGERRRTKGFSLRQYGFEEARNMAVRCKLEMEAKKAEKSTSNVE